MGNEGMIQSFGIKQGSDIHPIILDQMAAGADRCAAMEIASHPRALKTTLAKLAESEHVDVRCAVGENSNTPIDILWRLAQDEHPDVRFSLAENCHISQDILKRLCDDENPYVAVRASRTLERLAASIANTVVNQVASVFAFAS